MLDRKRGYHRFSRSRHVAKDGFLLVEALAALALGALILVGLLSLTGLLRRSADVAAARVETIEVAGRAVTTVANEIREARRLRWAPAPEDGRARAAPTPRPDAGGQNPRVVARVQPAGREGAGDGGSGGGGGDGGSEPDDRPRAFVFSGAPDRVIFAVTPEQANGLRAAVLVAWQVEESGALLRAEGPLPATATGPGAVKLGPVARVDPGPERLRFAFVDRRPNGGETVLDAWTDATRMPAAVRIDRSDARSGEALGSLRVPLLVDGEPGCVDPEKGFCSRVPRDSKSAPQRPPGQPSPSGEQE